MPSDEELLARLKADDRRWMEKKMRKCRFVEWDRFCLQPDQNNEGELVITVYGWIERDADDYKDFVTVDFWTATQNLSYTTSSDRYTLELYELLVGEPPGDDHGECQRVEHTFNVENCIELTEESSLEEYA